MNEVHFTGHNILQPPAIVREAFDERQLKAEWDDACADEQDAMSRKQAVLRKALARWPMVMHPVPNLAAIGRKVHSLGMRRFVRDVLGMPDDRRGGMNANALLLLRENARDKNNADRKRHHGRDARIKRAVVELVTKYRLGADAHECMEALAKFYEEQTNAQT